MYLNAQRIVVKPSTMARHAAGKNSRPRSAEKSVANKNPTAVAIKNAVKRQKNDIGVTLDAGFLPVTFSKPATIKPVRAPMIKGTA